MPDYLSEDSPALVKIKNNFWKEVLTSTISNSSLKGLNIFNAKVKDIAESQTQYGYIKCYSKGHEKNHQQGCYARF